MGNHICGLYFCPSGNPFLHRTYLPLVELLSETTINPVCFTTTLTQTYHNAHNEVLQQVRYTFPLYDGVAVNGYTISYAGKTLKGIVKHKETAKQDYKAAVDRGETAGLLESLPAGVFGVTLGNVPANESIVVEITCCGELRHDAAIDGLRFILPTSIAPRYGEYPGRVADPNAVARKGIDIRVQIDMGSSAIRRIQSPSHPIAVSMGGLLDNNGAPITTGDFKASQAAATLTLGTTELGGDFVLQLLIDDISKPQAILETHPTIANQRALMATLVPKFTLPSANPEIVFIADQSGSMMGEKNNALVSALKVFLKSLPLGVRFNICAFGNNFKFLWPKSQAYDQENLEKATAFVESFHANYGGTEILQPITAAFRQRLKDLPLEVMLMTDGEIWGEQAVFDYINTQIREKMVDARVFALGIGDDVSHTLVEGVARAGNGFAQFVTQNEETNQKVVRMLKGALYAHTSDYQMDVHYADDSENEMNEQDDFEIVEKVNECLVIADVPAPATTKQIWKRAKSFFDTSAEVDKPANAGGKVDRYAHLPNTPTPKLLQAPTDIPPLYPFNRTTLYLLLGPDTPQKPLSSITLRAASAEGPLELSIPVQPSQLGTGSASIHQLAARKAMQDLEEGRGWLQSAKAPDGKLLKAKHDSRFDELVERECVRLGEQFQVASKFTSFVAVQEKKSSSTTTREETAEEVFAEEQEDDEAEVFEVDMLMAAPSSPPSAGPSGRGAPRTAVGGVFRHRRIPMPPPARRPASTLGVQASSSAPPQYQMQYSLASAPAQMASIAPSVASGGQMSQLNVASFGAPPPPAPQYLQASQAELMLLEQQNKKRKVMCRQAAPAPAASSPGASSLFGLHDMGGGQSALAAPIFGNSSTGRMPSQSLPPRTPAQRMNELIGLQTAMGSWKMTPYFLHNVLAAKIDQITQTGILGGLSPSPDTRDDALATVLALAWLNKTVPEKKEVWEMLAEKGRAWLMLSLKVDEPRVEEIVKGAERYLVDGAGSV